MKNIILDCDIGVDDASALIMLLKNQQKVRLSLVSTVAGNSKIENVCNNTIFILRNFATRWVSVAVGASKPLYGERKLDASDVHGEGGLGGLKVEKQSDAKFTTEVAEEKIYKILSSSKRKITLVAIGPLTNIALLIKKHPEIVKKIAKIIIMGGSISGIGNITPFAEYNFAWDIDAAKSVVESGLKIYLSPIENANNMPVCDDEILASLKDAEHAEILKKIFLNLQDGSVPFGFALHDSCAAAFLLKPNLFKTLKCDIKINNDKKDKRYGQCFCEINKKGKNLVFVPKKYQKVKNFILKTTFGG